MRFYITKHQSMSFCMFFSVLTSLFFVPIIIISQSFTLLNAFSLVFNEYFFPFQSFSLPITTPSSQSYFSFPLPISSNIGTTSSISTTIPSTPSTNTTSPHNASSLVSKPNQSLILSPIVIVSSSKTSTSLSSPIVS